MDYSATSISFVTLRLNPFKNVTSLAFGGGSSGRLHIFAMSLFTSTSIWSNLTVTSSPSQEKALHPRVQPIGKAAPLNSTGPIPVVQYVRSTTKLNDTDLSLHSNSTRRIQLIEVVVHNLPSSSSNLNPNDTTSTGTSNWITAPYTISIDSPGVQTIFPATIHRLRAGLSARFFVGVSLSSSIKQRGSPSTAVAVISTGGTEVSRSAPFSITAGIPEYKDKDLESLLAHESAMWFDDAKFGIFVHWGVYAVPAFSPVGVQYAEVSFPSF
jgi:alpha-L-fucosidase